MKVLVIGSGAREHAIVWKLAQSRRVSKVFCAPGNPGIKMLAECVDIRPDNIDQLCEFARSNGIDLTVAGAERPYFFGLSDLFKKNGLLVFGPEKEALKICNSKSFAKNFMQENKVPTPRFGVFDKEAAAKEHLKKITKYPVIIKYDTHTTPQGIFICETYSQAVKTIEDSFSSLVKAIIIEEYIKGKEVSFPVVTDGYNAVPLVSSTIYKRSLDGDGGAYSQGVGAFAPSPLISKSIESKIAQKIVFPILDALSSQGTPYSGVLSMDLIIDDHNNIYAVEFNSSLGDPEAQTILPLLEEDLFEIMYSTAIGALGDDYESFKISDNKTTSIVLLSGNYPISSKKGAVIEGLENIDDDDIYVFHGEIQKNVYSELITDGGRVLSVTAQASTLNRARERAYEEVDLISFSDMRYRKDIAKFQVNNPQ